MNTNNNLGDYIGAVLDHIDNEYESGNVYGDLSIDEKYTIRTMLVDHYYNNNSPGNSASEIINYIRQNRSYN